MSKIAIIRTNQAWPGAPALEGAKALLFGAIDGFSKDDKRGWRRFWKRIMNLEPGEMAQAEMVFPRSGPFHRRHMALEQAVFDAQERFQNFKGFRDWLKIGAGHCEWLPGPKGGVIPIPDSTAYAAMDDEVFHTFHYHTIEFLRTPHALKTLWRHLDETRRSEMIEAILNGFDE